jgi:hypothetical protein
MTLVIFEIERKRQYLQNREVLQMTTTKKKQSKEKRTRSKSSKNGIDLFHVNDINKCLKVFKGRI